MDLNAANALTNFSDGGNRIVTFGGNTYYGVVTNDTSPRVQGWGDQLINQAALWGMPNEPDTKYWRQIQNTNYSQKTAFMSYTGTFSAGSPVVWSGTKLYDWTTNGTVIGPSVGNLSGNPPKHGVGPFAVGEDPWMDDYWGQVVLLDQMWEDHFIPALDTFSADLNYNFITVKHAQDPCIFTSVQYVSLFSAPSDALPQTDHNSSALSGAHGNFFNQSTNTITAISGNSTLTTTITGYPASLVGSTPPSGSTFIPAAFNVVNGNAGSPVISPYSDHTHYTWCSLSATTGTLNPFGTNCSSPSPVTPTASGSFTGGWILNNSCPATNGSNGIWGIAGGQGVGYAAGDWPIMNWWVALNGSDSNTNTAISLFSPLFATPGSVDPAWTASDHF
jgi:hypothetical protein